MTEINGTAQGFMKEEALFKANSSAEKNTEMMVNENNGKLVLTNLFDSLFIRMRKKYSFYFVNRSFGNTVLLMLGHKPGSQVAIEKTHEIFAHRCADAEVLAIEKLELVN